MSAIDRRKFLLHASAASAAAGAVWTAPSVIGSGVAFAAGSGLNTYPQKIFYKYNNSQSTYSQATACRPGYVQANLTGAANRGTVDMSYTGSTRKLCFTITLGSGPDIGTRTVYVLPSSATACLGAISSGTWGANTTNTYNACVVLPVGTTEVAISAEQSGGGGTAVYLIDHVTL